MTGYKRHTSPGRTVLYGLMANCWFFALPVVLLLSCGKKADDPEPAGSGSVSASFRFTGTASWPESYRIILGAFGDDTTKTSCFTVLSRSSDDEIVQVRLENIPSAYKKAALCLADNGNILYTFGTYAITGADNTVPLQAIDLLVYNRLQAQVFTPHCIACHGGSSGDPAAGMYLTKGKSYDQLVNHPSTESAKFRVKPNDAGSSFLVDVLRLNGIGFEHSASRSLAEENIRLIERWIDGGALR